MFRVGVRAGRNTGVSMPLWVYLFGWVLAIGAVVLVVKWVAIIAGGLVIGLAIVAAVKWWVVTMWRAVTR